MEAMSYGLCLMTAMYMTAMDTPDIVWICLAYVLVPTQCLTLSLLLTSSPPSLLPLPSLLFLFPLLIPSFGPLIFPVAMYCG